MNTVRAVFQARQRARGSCRGQSSGSVPESRFSTNLLIGTAFATDTAITAATRAAATTNSVGDGAVKAATTLATNAVVLMIGIAGSYRGCRYCTIWTYRS